MTTTAPATSADAPILTSVVYASRATGRFHDAELAMLLAASRIKNEARAVTGLLLHRDGRFMQVLEGPDAAVRRVLAIIAADPRHTDVEVLDEERIAERRFGSWAMGYRSVGAGEAATWFGSTDAGRAPVAGSRAAALLEAFRTA